MSVTLSLTLNATGGNGWNERIPADTGEGTGNLFVELLGFSNNDGTGTETPIWRIGGSRVYRVPPLPPYAPSSTYSSFSYDPNAECNAGSDTNDSYNTIVPPAGTTSGTAVFVGTDSENWTTKQIDLTFDSTPYLSYRIRLYATKFSNPSNIYNSPINMIENDPLLLNKSIWIELLSNSLLNFSINNDHLTLSDFFVLPSVCFAIDTIVPEKNILGEFCRVVKFNRHGKNLYIIPKDTFDYNVPNKDLKITKGHPFILNNNGIEICVEDVIDKYPQIKKLDCNDIYLATIVTNSRTICKIHGMDIITFCIKEFEEVKHKLGLTIYANL